MFTIVALCLAVLAFFSLTLLVPAATALWHADFIALEVFLALALFYALMAMLGFTAVLPRARKLNRAGLFRASVAMWLALVTAAIPPFILLEQNGLLSAFFESVSAATTLGVSQHTLPQMRPTMAIFRVVLAWQGGLLTLVLAIFVLGRTKAGGMPDRHIRLVLHSFENKDYRLWQTFLEIFVPYAALTISGAALLTLTRVPAGDALAISASMLSTNGFLPVSSGATILNNVAGEIVMMGLMLFGATSILWQRALFTRKWTLLTEQSETVQYLGIVLLLSLIAVISGILVPGEFENALHASFNRVFDMVSVLTTTGITHDARFGLGLPFELILGLAFVGGCAFSTAGGLGFFRLAAMIRHSVNDIQRLVYPHAILARSEEATSDGFQRSKAIWSAFYISLLTVLAAAMLFSVHGFALDHSLGLAIGGFSSTASLITSLTAHNEIAQWSDETITTLSLVALLGRIELLAVLAAFGRSNW